MNRIGNFSKKVFLLSFIIISISFTLSINIIIKNPKCINLENFRLKDDNLKPAGTFYDIEIDDTDPTKDWACAVAQIWCHGSGTQNDPYIIENHTFQYQSGSGNGLLIENSNHYFIIRNCIFTGSTTGSSFPYNGGLKLNNVNNGTIENSKFISNNGRGVVLYNSDHNKITHNVIMNNYHGISLASRCDHNIISHNLIENNSQNGLKFETTLGYENNYNNITSNKILTNGEHGICLEGYNDFNRIIDNDIIDNHYFGIGIMFYSDNNTIYHNFLVGNNENGGDYAYDNKWNSSLIGNYWSEYWSEFDLDGDGIGDIPFSVYQYGKDYLPIVDSDAPNITINYPFENEEFNNTVPSFNVRITDRYLNSMWYTLNDNYIKHYFTTNGSISQDAWNILPSGHVSIKFYAKDRALNEAFEEVIVIKPSEPVSNGVISFGFVSVIFSVLIGIVIVVWKVKNKWIKTIL